MAHTTFSDVIEPSLFTPYVSEMTIYKSLLFRSGILVSDNRLNSWLAGGGKNITAPFWKDLTNADEVPSESADVTAYNITTGSHLAVRQMRVAKWGATAMASQLAGDNAMMAIGDYVADWWDRRLQLNLISVVRGVIADNVANDSSDLVNDISIEDGNNATSANKISPEAVIDTIMKMGDHFDNVGAMGMHSTVFAELWKQELIDTVPNSQQGTVFYTYRGLPILVDDNLYSVAGSTSGTKYWTILYKRGGFSWGETTVNYEPTSIDRNEDRGGGIEYLHSRKVFCIHPQGFSFITGSVAGEYPTNAELAAAANWNRVAELKNTALCILITNG